MKNQPRSKTQVILVDGALRWGGTTAALWVFFNRLFTGRASVGSAIVAALVFPLVGACYGWYRWRASTRPVDSRTSRPERPR